MNTNKSCWIAGKHCMAEKGLEICGGCIMTSHVHTIIGTNKNKLEDIMRDRKRRTSEKLRQAILLHPKESRKEWMLWMMERAGRKNGNNIGFQFW
ncbi:MAG: Transposase like protein [Sphingobacteriales bacterium]|nr:Transposase like protein [Sphingobacteriales bacterium]